MDRCVQVGRRFHSIYREFSLQLLNKLWLAVDKVIHHDDVGRVFEKRVLADGRVDDRRWIELLPLQSHSSALG